MKKLLAACLFTSALLMGSVNEPMRWEYLTGYRIDHLHWHLQKGGSPTYNQVIRDLQFWENSVAIRTIYRDIALYATASYGAFGSGSWPFDGWGYLGYSVNLTADRVYKVILIPFAGYGANVLKIHQEHMCWYGPLFGGSFLIEPGGRLQFEAGYAYHRLFLRFSSKFGAGETDKLKVKDSANLAHSGWARMDYLLPKAWRIGLAGAIQYSASRVLDCKVKNTLTHQKTEEKFRARWTAVSGFFAIARDF